ncbi:MAG: diguanylate cyclase, partial [Pseudaminobacter sp.]|nr:diguanylate cyclase [Pseudaminobacter sp.]
MDQTVTHTLAEADLRTQRHEPVSVDLRVLYRQDADAARRKAARQGIWISFFVYLLFSITDMLLIPDVAPYTMAARFTVGLIMLPIFEIQFRRNVKADWLDITCAAALILAYLAWLYPALMTELTQSFSYYMIFGAVFMVGANLFFSFRFHLSLISSTMILAAFFLSLYVFPVNEHYRIAFGTFYVSFFTFSSYFNWKLNKERYNVFLNALEARIQQKEATERGKALLTLSRTDPLTGLENRRAVDEKLRDYWSDWQRLGSSFAAILVDVDFFKKFNDYYGHQEGDRCLIQVANALSNTIEQHNGSIGRYGGEEFIVLARMESREQVASFAEAIRGTVENLALLHEHRRDGMSMVTVSVGAAFTRK